MNERTGILGFYNYTVILTYIGAAAGFLGIVETMEENTSNAIVCLMVAGFCDMFDGAVASTMVRTRQEKCFGIQIDSLSDLICFGVLPALLVYRMNPSIPLTLGVSVTYFLCALIRLAYFNVDEQERQLSSAEPRRVYYGLPVTLSALVLPLVYGGCSLIPTPAGAAIAASAMTMAVLFLLPFPLHKPHLPGKVCVVLCGAAELLLVALSFGDV